MLLLWTTNHIAVKQIWRRFVVYLLVVHINNIPSVGFPLCRGYDWREAEQYPPPFNIDVCILQAYINITSDVKGTSIHVCYKALFTPFSSPTIKRNASGFTKK